MPVRSRSSVWLLPERLSLTQARGLEARGDETDIRLRGARQLRDIRSLGEVMKHLGPVGFVRHRQLSRRLAHRS